MPFLYPCVLAALGGVYGGRVRVIPYFAQPLRPPASALVFSQLPGAGRRPVTGHIFVPGTPSSEGQRAAKVQLQALGRYDERKPREGRTTDASVASYDHASHVGRPRSRAQAKFMDHAGGRTSRRNWFSRSALALMLYGSLQRRSSSVALAASGGEDRVAGQGDEVLVQYTGYLQDGTVLASSERQDPPSLIVGGGQIVKGLDDALRGMKIGEEKKVTLPPDQAYGERDENMIFRIPKEQAVPGLKQGQRVGIGQGMSALVTAINPDGSIVLDANTPLAGKTLVFDVKLSSFKNPPLQGLDMVGWQGKKFRVPFGRADSRVAKVFENPKWPAAWPYTPADFTRQDESTDNQFYSQPRFVTHIDNGFVGAIKSFYDLQFSQAQQGEYSVLDICSSWISHYPEKLYAKRVAITGMNEAELKANKQATEYVAKDLNVDPKLPYGDNAFDFVTNVVSVDYLNKPQEIFKEMHRVMKPGGVAIMSFSNRCFATKAISMWVANMNDGPGHCQIVGNYFRFSPTGGWKDISSVDISPNPGRSDPVWVVTAVKA